MATNENHRAALCDGLLGLKNDDKYTDFTLVSLDGREFRCHKVVLAAVSPFFDTLFNSSMKEAEEGRTELSFEGETITNLLQFIYTGWCDQIETTPSEIPALYYAANYLQIKTLQHYCEEILEKGTSYEISLEIWQIAKSFGNHVVAEVAKSIALQNFGAFCFVDSIGRISLEDLKMLLQDKSVNCSGSIKCKAAWVWLLAQPSPGAEVTKDLLRVLVASENVDNDDILTACSLDGDSILEMIGSEDIERIHTCRALWEGACKDLWIRAGELVNQRDRSLKDSLVIVGGTPSNESQLTILNYKEMQWYNLKAQTRDLGHRYAICAIDSMLYLSGGTQNSTAFLCFDADRGVWEQQQQLPVGREQHSMCTVPDNSVQTDQRFVRNIYVLGGSAQDEPNLKDVHMYNTRNRRWTKCGEVAYPVTAACSTVVDRRIYLLGGTDMRDKRPTDVVQCFDTDNGQSWPVRDIKLPFKAKTLKMGITCIASEKIAHEVYLLHERVMYKLHLGIKNQSIEKAADIPGAPSKGFAVTSFGERVFIFGGEDDNFRIVRSVFQYDTRTKQVVTLPVQTPDKIRDFAYTFLLVPTSWDLTEIKGP